MAFKPIKPVSVSLDSPENLFRDLRQKKVAGLLSQQADLLRKYVAEGVGEPDVALQMPTGGGKTLVGLLIAEWRRRKFAERVVYLCPTNQLVNQVVQMANTQYGLQVVGFTGKKAEYDTSAKAEWTAGDTVGITSYSSLFNVRPFFENPHTIVLDDAHSAENYIPKLWTVRISRSHNDALFRATAAVFLQDLPETDQHRIVKPQQSGDRTAQTAPGDVRVLGAG